MLRIGVYGGAGVDTHSLACTLAAFHKVNHEPIVVYPSFFLSDWASRIDVLVFPGGRDVPYHETLKGAPNQSIRYFVEQGGCYFGICAGAYYGAAQIQFAMNTNLEIVANRELSFYSGRAVGPVYGADQFCYRSLRGARLAQVSWAQGSTEVYFNGGCSFIGGSGDVIAAYQDLDGNPPAIISCSIGAGKAILCGVHPEYSAASIPDRVLNTNTKGAFDAQPSLWNYLCSSFLEM